MGSRVQGAGGGSRGRALLFGCSLPVLLAGSLSPPPQPLSLVVFPRPHPPPRPLLLQLRVRPMQVLSETPLQSGQHTETAEVWLMLQARI